MIITLLILHLSGAVALGAVLLSLIAKLWRGATENATYLRLAKFIAVLASLQMASGLGLVVASPSMSTFKVCSNIAIYWAVVVVAELVIVRRVQKQAIPVTND